jgi:hypothetical protein
MASVDPDEWKRRARPSSPQPVLLTFLGQIHLDKDGKTRGLNVAVRVEDGDRTAAGGLGGEEGVLFFVPWPCTSVEIDYPDEPEPPANS